jgi:hypothetical protein
VRTAEGSEPGNLLCPCVSRQEEGWKNPGNSAGKRAGREQTVLVLNATMREDIRIIFSRKGFDSGTGRVASPILPEGGLWSLPIPANESPTRYREIQRSTLSLDELISALARGRIASHAFAHLDPDLLESDLPRLPGWKPLFGQTGAAESHLRGRDIQPGDIFLFYGWFRRVELVNGLYSYAVGAPDLHVLFGWLQVEQRISVYDRSSIPPWAIYHPHCAARTFGPMNALYLSSDRLSLPGVPSTFPGAGLFPRFHPCLQLTAEGEPRSRWRLPGWLYPGAGKNGLSYHGDHDRWSRDGDGSVLLNTVARGQEFVLDTQQYPEAVSWLARILGRALTKPDGGRVGRAQA